VAALFYSELTLATVCFAAATVLALSRFGLPLLKSERASKLSSKFSVLNLDSDLGYYQLATIIFSVIVLAGALLNLTNMNMWLFTVPLMLLFFFEFKSALSIVGVYAIVTVILVNRQQAGFVSVEFVPSFILFLGMGCALVYLRELRRRQLQPLRRTDNLSHDASERHLNDDLTKEVQRSEREGSDLSAIALAVDDLSLAKLDSKELDIVHVELGKLLHNNLRIFDSYYGLSPHHFLIILPHTSSNQALKIADSLRLKIKQVITIKNENITTSMGITNLNVGDDSKSVVVRAQQALHQAQEKGANRSQLYRETNHKDTPDAPQENLAE
jgi:diguanylate cyclase (GGDEF)-like protein